MGSHGETEDKYVLPDVFKGIIDDRLICRILDLRIQRHYLSQDLASKRGKCGVGKKSREYRKVVFPIYLLKMLKLRSLEKSVFMKLYERVFLSTEFPGDEC